MTAPVRLQGIIPPLTTPFDAQGELDEDAIAAQVRWMIEQGVHGLVVGGSTGEGYTLTVDELARIAQSTIEAAEGRVPVVASIIADSTREVTRRVRRLAPLPLAALQITPPHYIFEPEPEGLVEFYARAADESPFPLIIYNVIPWTPVSPALARRLVEEVPEIVAIKQSKTDLGLYAEMVRTLGADRVFAALDEMLRECYEAGAAGSIAAIGTAAPSASLALWEAVRSGSKNEAARLQADLGALWQTLVGPNMPARVKVAQQMQGIQTGHPRSPMHAPDQATRDRIANALASIKPETVRASPNGAGLLRHQ
ncbi:MAG TPA: dihydrodipicolinate synthase family protein [Dongiaceae bacterium]|nr:dihydrodipicolinate synthase family protein [Dongiaceae bacterium]